MHECIAQLCIDFYYNLAGGKRFLARQFPEDFQHRVPERAVALAATCVSRKFLLDSQSNWMLLQVFNCLDEYWNGRHMQRKFSAELNSDAYESILDLVQNINGNDHHKAKWVQARRDWTRRGM